jgi:hypothetical protein
MDVGRGILLKLLGGPLLITILPAIFRLSSGTKVKSGRGSGAWSAERVLY